MCTCNACERYEAERAAAAAEKAPSEVEHVDQVFLTDRRSQSIVGTLENKLE
jgi:hypothetical protein